MPFLREVWLVYVRSIWIGIHNPVWIGVGLLQPILYLVLFAPLLSGLSGMPGFEGGALNTFLPGLLILQAMFGSLFVGFGLLGELREGVVERLRVTPLKRLALLMGRVFADITNFLMQSVILILLALPFGLDVDVVGVILVLLLMVLIGLGVAPLSYAAALALKSEDAFAPAINMVVLPLMLLSGVLLPIELAPDWLQVVAHANPLYYAVEAARALFNGDLGDPNVYLGIGIWAVVAALALWLGSRSFGRAVA